MAAVKPTDNMGLEEKKSPTANAESHAEISVFKMFRYAKGFDRLLLVLGVLLAFTLGALIPLQSIVFGSLTDGLIAGQANWTNNTFDFNVFQSQTISAIMDYVYLGIACLLLGYFVMACWYTSCERQIHRIRRRFFAAVLRQNVAWFDVNQAGAITTKMSDGIDRMKEGMGDKIGILCQSLAQFVCGLTIAFVHSWKMTLVMMAIVPFIAVTMFLSIKLLSSATRKEMYEYGKAGAIAEEVMTAIRTVMAFNGQEHEMNRYEKRLEGAKKMGIRKAIFNGALTGMSFLLIFIAMAIGFWYAALLVSHGEMSPGTTFTVFWSVMMGTFAIGQAGPQFGVIIAAKTAAAAIFAIIDRKPEIDCQSDEGKKIDKPEGRISFQSVHFRYPTRPDVPVLNGVSYTVEPGQTVALVGHSGCGKSTMVSLLLRYYDAESGLVTIDGVRVNELNINWLRNTVGVVSQEPVLFDTTIEQNLKLGNADLTQEDMVRMCTMANAHDFVMKLPKGYQTLVGEGGVQLSGGQKQRIAIARALSRDPKILLLDEATSALDAESEGIVQEALEKASKGRTTLTIAHRLSTIRNADRILVFEHGNIVESGTHDSLMTKNGHYFDLVQAQAFQETGENHLDAIQEEEDDPTVAPNMRNRGTSMGMSFANQQRRSINRMSNRLNRSMTRQTSEVEREKERVKEELEDEGVSEASLFDIIKFARQEWPLLIIAFLFAAVRGLMWPAFSLIYGQIFKTLSSPNIMEGAVKNALLFVALGLVMGGATLFSGWIFGAAGEKLTMRLRMAVLRNLLRQDASYFDHPSHSSGKLTTRLATDAPNVKSAIDNRLAELFQGAISLIVGIAIAFFYDWRMAPIGILTAVALVLLQSAIAQYLKRRSTRDVPLAEDASRLAAEAIGNLRTVQYLTREKHFYALFEAGLKAPHRTTVTKGLWQALAYGMSASFMFFNFASAYRFGVWLVQNKWTEPYAVFQVIEALNLSSMGVMTAAAYFPEYVKARLAAGLMFGMIRQEPKIDNLSDAGVKKEITGNIALSSLYFAYPARPQHSVLRGLNVKADVGMTLALVGPSGCGKSTVIQLLERFYDPIDGRVTIDDTDLRTLNIRHTRSQIALVSQEPTLFDCSIRDNITYGLSNISQQQIEDAAKLANIHSFVSGLPDGYNTNVGAKGTQLSGGQKQRIAIARAMVRNPKVLLLDEATSALDTESEKIVQEALDKARQGRTCIVIAHRLSTIQNADVIAVVRNGAVVEQGTHSQLLGRKGLYYRLIQKQDLK